LFFECRAVVNAKLYFRLQRLHRGESTVVRCNLRREQKPTDGCTDSIWIGSSC
jgi:hypothetical protein